MTAIMGGKDILWNGTKYLFFSLFVGKVDAWKRVPTLRRYISGVLNISCLEGALRRSMGRAKGFFFLMFIGWKGR